MTKLNIKNQSHIKRLKLIKIPQNFIEEEKTTVIVKKKQVKRNFSTFFFISIHPSR